ncbi:MAG: hypothetical protein PHW95_02010 [Patescibacteria group bacterium]|nr:hypothetical protein [Patescibacteria group bacterium]
MPSINDWGSVATSSLNEIWFRFVDLVPNLIGAALVLIVGIFLAQAVGRVIAKLIHKIYVDRAAETTGLTTFLQRLGFKLEISRALGLLVTWFLYIIILVATAEILGLDQISQFLGSVVLYIPNVLIAVVILLVGIIVSNFVHTLVKEMSIAANLDFADSLANVAKWALLIFTFMAALIQLRVATELIQILFTGLVLMVSLAGGIAFGLGGKDQAKEFLDKLIK